MDFDNPDKINNSISYHSNGQIREGFRNGVNVEYGTNPKYYQTKTYNSFYKSVTTVWKKDTKIIQYSLMNIYHGGYKGLITEWHKNGQIVAQGKYDSPNKNGFWEYFYEDGNPMMKGKYVYNQQVGIWSYWDQKGNKMKV